MDMSTLSRSELVGELLAHDRRYLPDEVPDERLHVADGEPSWIGPANVVSLALIAAVIAWLVRASPR